MRYTLENVLLENNHKRTIDALEELKKLSATIECLNLDQSEHDALIKNIRSAIETMESASFQRGKEIAEK